MFGSIAKWVFEVTDPAQVAEAAFRADLAKQQAAAR